MSNSADHLMHLLLATLLWPCGSSALAAEADTHAKANTSAGTPLPKWRDWPNWRGPTCSGSAIDYPHPLVDNTKKATLLWTSEEAMQPGLMKSIDPEGGEIGFPLWGFSSFAIVDRRLYFFHPRPSGESTALSRGSIDEYARRYFKWSGNTYMKEGKPVPRERLDRYAKVRATDVFMGLDAVTGRTLWKAEMEGRGVNIQYVRPRPYSIHNVPCWNDGRVFAHGSSFRVYGIDAVTGEPLWESDLGPRAWFMNYMYADICLNSRFSRREGRHGADFRGDTSSMTTAGGAVIGRGQMFGRNHPDSMTAFDIRSGRRLWYKRQGRNAHFNSPLRWTAADGKDYVIIYGADRYGRDLTDADGKIVCLDPMTGTEIWSVSPFPVITGTIAVSRDWMVAVDPGKMPGGMYIYKVAPDGAVLDKKIPGFAHGGMDVPTIYGNMAYFQGKVVDLQTGKVTVCPSGYAAGGTHGKVISNGMRIDKFCAVLPDGPKMMMKMPGQPEFSYGETNVVAGRLFVRGRLRWWAFDMRADQSIEDRYSNPIAPEHEVQVDSAFAFVQALGAAHWTDRMQAVDAFPLDQTDAAQDLAKLLIEAPYPSAKAASKVLQKMGPAAQDVAASLAAALPSCAQHGGYGRILLLCNAINAIDAAAAAPQAIALAKLLTSEQDLVLANTCKALELLGPHAAAAVPALVAQLESDDSYRFRHAALALAGIGPAAGQTAIDALSQHLDHDVGECLVHALLALSQTGGTLTEATINKLMTIAFTPDPAQFTQFNHAAVEGPHPQLRDVHVLAFLAAKCLRTRADQTLTHVISHLQATSKDAPPTMMHYRILGELGSKAAAAVPLMEQKKDLVWHTKVSKRTIGKVVDTWIKSVQGKAQYALALGEEQQ